MAYIIWIWVPEALLNLIYFLSINYRKDDWKSEYDICKHDAGHVFKLLMKSLIFISLVLIVNALTKSYLSKLSLSGLILTVTQILLYKLLYKTNFRKASIASLISMFAIMNTEVAVISLYQRWPDIITDNPYVLSIPTKIIQISMIVFTLWLRNRCDSNYKLLEADWNELDATQRVNFVTMILMMSSALFCNANLVDILFSVYRHDLDFGGLSINFAYTFISTLLFAILSMYAFLRMGMYQQFHYIARTVKDSPIDLYSTLIATATEEDKEKYLKLAINAYENFNYSDLVNFVSKYDYKHKNIDINIQGMEKITEIKAGLQLRLFGHVLDELLEAHGEIEGDVTIFIKEVEKEGLECFMKIKNMEWQQLKSLLAIVNSKVFKDIVSMMKQKNLNISKSVSDDEAIIAIN